MPNSSDTGSGCLMIVLVISMFVQCNSMSNMREETEHVDWQLRRIEKAVDEVSLQLRKIEGKLDEKNPKPSDDNGCR